MSEAEPYEIKVFSLDGKALPSVRKEAKTVAVAKQDIADDMNRLVAMMGEKFRPVMEKQYATIPMPKALPPYRELLVDSQDNLWVREYARTGANASWTVFDRHGKQRAELALPNALEVYEIGRDYILGRYIDPDADIPEVRVYRLKRTA